MNLYITKNISFGILLLSIICNKLYATTVVIDSTFTSQSIGTFIETYSDYTETITIEDVLKDSSIVFEQNFHHQVIGGARKDAFYWVRFPVYNATDSKLKLVLHTNDIRIRYIYGFDTKDGCIIKRYNSGLNGNFNDKVVPYRSSAFPFELEAKKNKVFYIKINNRIDPIQFPIFLSKRKLFFKNALGEYFALGIFHGILLFLVVIAFLLVIFLQQRLFVYYFFYVFSILMVSIGLSGLGFQFFYQNSPYIAANSKMIWAIFSFCAIYFFVIEYFRLENADIKFAKAIAKYIKPLIVVMIGILVFQDFIDFDNNPILSKVAHLAPLPVTFMCILILYTIIKFTVKDAKWNNIVFLIGYSSICIYGVLYFPINFGIIPLAFDKFNLFRVVILIETTCLTTIVFHRIWVLRNEKTELDHEIKIARLAKEQANKIQAIDIAKARFYTNITHEFRTPLTVIKGLANEIDCDESHKKLIQRNSDNLLKLINQLLDLSKSESGELKLRFVRNDILSYIRYLNENFKNWCASKDIKFYYKESLSTLEMDYDPQRIQEVLTNLVANAIKFTAKGGEVALESTVKEGSLIIKVIDTGIGIGKTDLLFIFDRFYQIDHFGIQNQAGTGIGLSHSKELVRLMGGKIGVESTLESGSTFIVEIPISKKAEVESSLFIQTSDYYSNFHMETSFAVENNLDKGQKRSILVIEDNLDVQKYISICLATEYNVMFSNDGEQGIKRAISESPDLIICDIMMPIRDGYSVCKKVKTDIITSHIPFIMLTAKATHEDKMKGLKVGADAYLYKPFDKPELLLKVKNLILQKQKIQVALRENIILSSDQKYLKEKSFLEEVEQIIRVNYKNEQFSVEVLAQKLFMSRSQLYRKIKALTNRSIASYIRLVRLTDGKLQLKNTDKTITSIALDVGFNDLSYFSSSFTKEFGYSPNSVVRN